MADPLDVLTLAEAKQALNISESVIKHDAELPSYITAVSQRLDLYIGPVVQRTVTNEVHDGGRPSVFLSLFPVVSVTQVIEYCGTTSTVLAAESNAVKPEEGYLLERYDPVPSLWSGRVLRRKVGRAARFEPGQANVAVSYVAGRCVSTAEVPPALQARGEVHAGELLALADGCDRRRQRVRHAAGELPALGHSDGYPPAGVR